MKEITKKRDHSELCFSLSHALKSNAFQNIIRNEYDSKPDGLISRGDIKENVI